MYDYEKALEDKKFKLKESYNDYLNLLKNFISKLNKFNKKEGAVALKISAQLLF